MPFVVQKFGGSSLADIDAIRRCANRAAAAHLDGNEVVVVVSAMGNTTDDLIALARRVNRQLPAREMDLLLATGEQASTALMAMAIADVGVAAVSRTARDMGIRTSPVHGRARILAIDATSIRRDLDARRIVVIPGFLGLSETGEITTFGRGGSDTTAVAIAAVLRQTDDAAGGKNSSICEIYTDVDGVYTADPRVVPQARKLPRVSYVEMVELAALGAGVLNTRAVLFGRRHGVPIHVRSSRLPDSGTHIVKETPQMERVSVVGCALTSDLGRITVRQLPNRPGVASAIFARVADGGILVDDIMQIEAGDSVDISFTVEAPQLAELKLAVQSSLEAIGSDALISVDVGLAKVSAVGLGMRTHTGVAATMFKALADAGINIANVTTSEVKISCILPQEHGERALRIVHDAFGLDRSERGPQSAVQAGLDRTEIKLG